jgi:hypothetical protein
VAETVAPADRTFELDGRVLRYPAHFRDGSSLMTMYLVPVDAANEQIASSGFTAARVAPGRTIATVVAVHYTDTDCGDYDELAWSVMVQPLERGRRVPYAATVADLVRGRVASYAWRLAVSTTLSRDAGVQMWGYPKTVEDLRYRREGGRASMAWHDGETEVIRLTVPDTGTRTVAPISPPVYSVLDGEPVVGNLTQSYTGVGYHRTGAEIRLGDHPVADELRRLGLPKRPILAVWNGHLSFRMSAPRPLRSPFRER